MHFSRQNIVRQRDFSRIVSTRTFLQNIDRATSVNTGIYQEGYNLKTGHPANQI
jgi:hypothetical protein